MRAHPKAATVLLPLLALGACVSFKADSPLPNRCFLEQIEICREVKETDDEFIPSDPAQSFTDSDGCVYCFVKARTITDEVNLRWKWYSPDGNMWRDSGSVVANQGKDDLSAITAYDVLKIDQDSVPKGEWVAVFFVDEVLLGRKKFRIL